MSEHHIESNGDRDCLRRVISLFFNDLIGTTSYWLGILGLGAALVSACTGRKAGNAGDDVGAVFLADRLGDAEFDFARNRFRSVLDDATRSDVFTLDHETRRGFLAPLPSSIDFPVTVPPGAVLRFALGVASLEEGVAAPPVRFRIRYDDETLFEETVGRHDVWIDRELELDGAPRNARLIFETEWRRQPPPDSHLDTLTMPLWGSPIVTSRDTRSDRPLLVLISIDCLRADHVGAYGYDRSTTPNIDRLAGHAVVFEEAVTTSAWTLPTHMSMMTGLTPSQHGVFTQERKLNPETPFLPELLHQAGYETTGIVTWWFVSQLYGFDEGFDRFRLHEAANADAVVDDAIEQLALEASHGRFIFLHLLDPHWEYTPPADLLEAFGPRPPDISRLLDMAADGNAPEPGDVEEIERLYDGEIAFADRELGRFFDALRNSGLYDEALIVVTADHGEGFYEHASWQHGTLYDEIVRVPLIVKFPLGEAARVAFPVSSTSIFSTFLEIANVETPEDAPPSLTEYLNSDTSSLPSTILSEYYVMSEPRHGTWPPPQTSLMVAFRRDGTKYIATLGGEAYEEVLREEIYDSSDETVNLIADRAGNAEAFRELLEDYLGYARRLEAARAATSVALDEDTKRLLESLGYTTR